MTPNPVGTDGAQQVGDHTCKFEGNFPICDGFLCKMEIVHIVHSDYFDYKGAF